MSKQIKMNKTNHSADEITTKIKHLKKKLSKREAELKIINSIGEAMTQKLDLETVTKLIGDKIREIFKAEVTEILLLGQSDNMVRVPYSFFRDYQKVEPFSLGKGLTSYVIKTRKPLVIGKLKDQENYGAVYEESIGEADYTESYLGVPIINEDTVLGVVSVQSYKKNAFSEDNVRLLSTLSSNIGVAFKNAELFEKTVKLLEETKQQAIELKIINSVGEGLAKQLDFQSIIDLVGERIREVFNAEIVTVSTYDAEKNKIHHRYAVELNQRYYFKEPIDVDPGRREIIQTRRPLIFETSAEYIKRSGGKILAGEMPESYMGVPILRNRQVTGVITVQDLKKQNLYRDKDASLLMTLAANMGVALENARLFEETKRLLNETQQRNVELSILNVIQEGLVEEMDFQAIINLVGDKFREALNFQDLGVRLYDNETDTLHFPYEYEHGERLYLESMAPTPISKYVLTTGKVLHLQRNTDEELARLGISGKVTINGTDRSMSVIAVPIISGNIPKGLLIIEDYEKYDAFSESDVRLLTTVANSMSVALENARLFNETLRLLDESKKRTAELSTVNSISQAIVSHLEIKNLINLVGTKVRDLFNANIVYLALLDKSRGVINFPYGYGDEFPPLKLGEGLTSHIIIKKEPLLINKEMEEKTEALGVNRIGIPSASYLGVPIPVGDEIIGVLSVQSTEKENVFNEDDLRLLTTIAAHVGIAINNANAYEELNKTLINLKATQNQLVAQEKLASLGQLTAGIAHEIKNPLNFVNNFSELSVNLVDELKEGFTRLESKIDVEDFSDMSETLNMLQQNAEKIREHGKRADSIVHSMLQHSRGKAGEKQMTDLNSMLDEDLNLVYHGLRAQDSGFNITIVREYEEKLEKINIIPQDISRVFLNILSNGCYEANRKKIELKSGEPAEIKVSTRDTGKNVEVRIRDNGSGIPKEIRGQLFTPFFTTKPAGKGTGLGLSISYDIVVQEHHGELFFETEEGSFTEFVIRLPK